MWLIGRVEKQLGFEVSAVLRVKETPGQVEE